MEILESVNKPDTANNNGNYVRSTGISLIVWDYLTDANNWFLVDSTLAGMYLNWFDRVPLGLQWTRPVTSTSSANGAGTCVILWAGLTGALSTVTP